MGCWFTFLLLTGAALWANGSWAQANSSYHSRATDARQALLCRPFAADAPRVLTLGVRQALVFIPQVDAVPQFSLLPLLACCGLSVHYIALVRIISRNLTGNALQATPQGGLVTLSAQPLAGGGQPQAADAGASLSPETLQERAADPRRRVAQQRGAGPGLLLSRTLALAQGGSLRLLNSPARPGVLAQVALPTAH